MTEQQVEQLESIINSSGLVSVLDALSRICSEKAEHADTITAKHWEKVAKIIGATSSRLEHNPLAK